MGALLGPGLQAALGIGQLIGGLFKHKSAPPAYNIPGQYQQNIDLAKGISNMGMDATAHAAAEQGIAKNTSFGLSTLRSYRAARGGVSGIISKANDATLNLESQANQIAQKNKILGTQMEIGANKDLAGQQLAKQNWEQFQPFVRSQQESSQLESGGIQNIFGGLNNMSMIGMLGIGKGGGASYGELPTRRPAMAGGYSQY